ncbi:cobalt-precorrin-6A reductase [Chelatococcus reniformis]|uniref:Precorrin-6A reductase n=1 Tax=Chelatococcus reniformis TaxID=1494448 RepID=A0A916XM94_9HYPH|nr:cobalt-precorrin-6A reductase [Chelatococcus reniformis]GGC86029.1 precorrin-6A reductase [Chelatococcus reniformis]
MTIRVLILGGTAEARRLAAMLVESPALAITLSLAGRTANPVPQPVPARSGGFGGAAGLAAHLVGEAVDLLVDATHPHAARISANAVAASVTASVPLLALARPPWTRQAGDRWTEVADVAGAVQALGPTPRRVFLALGRQEVGAFVAAPEHRYLIRSVDRVAPRPALPDAAYIVARGPFAEADDRALLIAHGIEVIVAKNSGGEATYGKIAAARTLGIEVILVSRPALPHGPGIARVATVEAAAAWVAGFTAGRVHASGSAERGE